MSLALTPLQDAVRCEFLAFLLVGMGIRLCFSSLTIGQTLLKGVVLTGLCPSTAFLPPALQFPAHGWEPQAASAPLPCPPRSVGESRALAVLTGTQSRL